MYSNKRYITIFILMTAALLVGASFCSASSLQDRMKERVPSLNALKSQGVIGENNQGFLEFLASPQQQDLIDGENSDRNEFYTAVAKRNNVDPALVGKKRAEQLAEKGVAGYWYQDKAGNWYQK